MDWDNLRVFLMVARCGSFQAASRRLKMDATTVARRVARLESKLGVTLFTRTAHGLQLTERATALLDVALRMEAELERLGAEDSLATVSGTVRISAAEGFSAAILAPGLPAFLADRPGLTLEIVANPGFVSAATRVVDIAITLEPPQSSRLKVEKLTSYSIGLYASKAYLERAGPVISVRNLEDHAFIGFIDDLVFPVSHLIGDIAAELRPHARSTSILTQLALAERGGGVCLMPDFMIGEHSPLQAVLRSEVLFMRDVWMSAHVDLHNATRIRAVRGWLHHTVAAAADRLSGH